MSEIKRVVIQIERADGSRCELRALNPAGATLTFTDDGQISAVAAADKPVVFEVAEP